MECSDTKMIQIMENSSFFFWSFSLQLPELSLVPRTHWIFSYYSSNKVQLQADDTLLPPRSLCRSVFHSAGHQVSLCIQSKSPVPRILVPARRSVQARPAPFFLFTSFRDSSLLAYTEASIMLQADHAKIDWSKMLSMTLNR